MNYRIGIIAALAGELKPLVSGWSQQPDGVFLTQRGDLAAIAVAKGIGAQRAEKAVAIAESYGQLDALVSIGWSGGASCGVQPGTAYEVGEVIDAVTGERYATSAAGSPIKLVTLDHVAGRDESVALPNNRALHWWTWRPRRSGGPPGRKAFLSTAGRRSPILPARICRTSITFWTRRSSCVLDRWPHTL